jgi:hypothetical protein
VQKQQKAVFQKEKRFKVALRRTKLLNQNLKIGTTVIA